MEKEKFEKLFQSNSLSDWQFERCSFENLMTNGLAEPDQNIVVMDSRLNIPDPDNFLSIHGKKLLVLFERDDIGKMIDLMNRYPSLSHFLCSSERRYPERLVAILKQITETKALGFQPHLDLHEKSSITVTSSLQKKEVLTRLSRFSVRLAGFNEFAETVETIGWELMSNAIFNAPVDPKSGERKYIHVPRDKAIDLAHNEHIEVEFGVHDKYLALTVKDKFGLLDSNTVVQNLTRCQQKGQDQVRTTTGGAGMGMFMVLNMASQLDMYVIPNVSTTIACLINFSKRQKEYEEYGIALNMFFKE